MQMALTRYVCTAGLSRDRIRRGERAAEGGHDGSSVRVSQVSPRGRGQRQTHRTPRVAPECQSASVPRGSVMSPHCTRIRRF